MPRSSKRQKMNNHRPSPSAIDADVLTAAHGTPAAANAAATTLGHTCLQDHASPVTSTSTLTAVSDTDVNMISVLPPKLTLAALSGVSDYSLRFSSSSTSTSDASTALTTPIFGGHHAKTLSIPPTPPLSAGPYSCDLMESFLKMPVQAQDRFLMNMVHKCLSKKQMSLMANLILPHLRLDILRHLPHELAVHVMAYLPVKSLCRLACVSKYYNAMARDDHLWRSLCMDYGFMSRPSLSVYAPHLLKPINVNCRRYFQAQYIIRSNWETGKCTQFSVNGPQEAIVTSLQFDDERLVIATDNATFGLIDIFDSRNGTRIRRLEGHEGGVWALEFQGDLLVSGGCDRDLRVWEMSTGKLLHRLPGHTSTIRCLKMIDEKRCVTGSRDNSVRIWDIQKGSCLSVLSGHTGSIRCIAVHGDRVVSGSYDNTLRVWDMNTGDVQLVLDEHHAQIYSVAFNDKYICSGSLDADIRVWNPVDGSCIWTFEGHDALVGHLQLRDDTLVSGGSGGRICVWNLKNGDFVKRINAHAHSVTTLQCDDRRIVSGGDDGIRIWDLLSGRLIRSLAEDVTGVWRLQFNTNKLIAAVQRGDDTSMEIMDFNPL